MDLQKLKALIDDPACSDAKLVKAIIRVLSDGCVPTDIELREIEKLGAVCDKKRPGASEKFREWFLKTHGKDCPACRKLQKPKK